MGGALSPVLDLCQFQLADSSGVYRNSDTFRISYQQFKYKNGNPYHILFQFVYSPNFS